MRYDEYDAEGESLSCEVIDNRRSFTNGAEEEGEPHRVTITFNETSPGSTVVEVIEDGFIEQDPELIPKLVDNKEGWVYALTCLKGYLEFGVNGLRAALVNKMRQQNTSGFSCEAEVFCFLRFNGGITSFHRGSEF